MQDALNVHMGTYFWSLGAAQIQLLQAAGIPAFILGLPFWVAMTRFIDKGSAFLIGIGLLSIFTMLSPLLQIIGWYPAAGEPCLSGNPGWLHRDCDLWRHCGRRQEGIFFATLAFAVKATVGVGQLVAGVSIDAVGLSAGAAPGTVSPSKRESVDWEASESPEMGVRPTNILWIGSSASTRASLQSGWPRAMANIL